jgi:hypothetical protein
MDEVKRDRTFWFKLVGKIVLMLLGLIILELILRKGGLR